ncbi:hypothetical protein [Pseudaquabacterium pictum]|uniref:Uncharacterized protein n=1 Tax=Pseudaquabacterium pictum TaxID=2315236 RepID=A0A480ATT8_9BURK|nr:hypothetical protein [Rubrivivax pictus]GCL64954.1 hypothetical protein AQPW35_40350 [Rubrivivax pictus]
MVKPRRFSLWWVGAAWLLVGFAGSILHHWALASREVAEGLLIVYGSALYAICSWWVIKWVDAETERRARQDAKRD